MNRLYKAFLYSLQGILATFKREAAFRQEVVLSFILVPIALFLDISPVERVLLISSLFIIFIIEILNSAVEAAIDRISQKKHELSKIAKDAGSAAVFMSILNAIVVWAVILIS